MSNAAESAPVSSTLSPSTFAGSGHNVAGSGHNVLAGSGHNVPFNRPFLTGKETQYIEQAVAIGKISGNGEFTQRCHAFFESRYGIKKALLTSSCTDALEMAALLCDLQPGDQVILPSYTFVSSANPFLLRGAELVFADSSRDNPNISPESIEALITPKTKAIVVVHYGGVSCDMDAIMSIARSRNILVVEDAAHAIESFYRGKALGTIGDLGTFSFHETKNIISGEGGLLAINNPKLMERAEILWEKGTNRAAFARGEVAKYTWVDLGSSFLASDITAAFLLAQLESLEKIQNKRCLIWNRYYENLHERLDWAALPSVPNFATVNGHLFYLVVSGIPERTRFINHMNSYGVQTLFHYIPLHSSPYYMSRHQGHSLPNTQRFADGLIRLPLYYELTTDQVDQVCDAIYAYTR